MKSLIKDKDIRKKILDLLSRREHSKHELISKLERRVDSPDKLVQEIEKLTVQNLQSDERFSESYILSRYNSGFGPTRIKYDLLTRRVTESVINNAFKELDLNWIEKLEKENLKKYGKENPKSMQELSKRTKFFIQRGFEEEMIRKIINL